MCAKASKYIELYSELRHAILTGEFPDGSFLPTENELACRYQVSKTTIRHAIRLLKDHGLVDVRQGSGTKVLSMKQQAVTGSKYKNPDSAISVTVHYSCPGDGTVGNMHAVIDQLPADGNVASALCIRPGDPVYRIQRLQLVDGLIFGYMVNYISVENAPELPAKGDLTTDLYGHLFRHYGTRVLSISETVDAVSAGFMEAQYLQVEIGSPLLLLKRVAIGQRGPVEYCETTVRPDIFHMTVNIRSEEPPETAALL